MCRGIEWSMDLTLLVLLLAAFNRDDRSKQALQDALAFYREHRELFALLAGAQQKGAGEDTKAEEPAADALLSILLGNMPNDKTTPPA